MSLYPIATFFSKTFEIGAKRIGEERDVARMDDQVRAGFDPSQLIFDSPPIMHSHTDATASGFGDDR